jgi:branched-chain amino acid transport system permease protein
MIANMLTSRIVTDILGGVASGVVIGLVALSLVLVWQSTNVLNFAQGAMAMFATYVGMTQLDHHLNYWLCALISVVVGFFLGGITERVLVRPLYGKAEINPIVVMVGFLSLLEAVASSIWSSIPRFPIPPFSTTYFQSAGSPTGLSPFALFQIVAAFTVMALVALLFRSTNLGLQLRAAALAPEVARLLGVRVGRLLTLGWALSTAVGVVAAVVISSGDAGLFPANMESVFVAGFIAAAIGGLESPGGALLAGVVIGVIMQFINDYMNSGYAGFVGVILLVASLVIRPQGLFTKSTQRRV